MGVREIRLDGTTGLAELVGALRVALDGGPAVMPVSAVDPRLDSLRRQLAPEEPVEPGTAVVVTTSGSTGSAKGVVLSASALRASAAATHSRLGGPGRWLLALPAQHIAGIQVIVRSLLSGVEPAVFSQTFADVPDDVRYVSLVPTQLARLSDLKVLRRFDAVLVGGAAAAKPLVARALDAGVRVVTTYGMSETAGGCVYNGVPLPGVRVRIVDGVIELAGPMLATGYRRSPAETAAAFVDGWFRTSDLGVFRDGSLEVLGRADSMINTGGVKVSPSAVEAVLAAQPGVAEACVVDLPDAQWGQLVAAVVVPVDPLRPPVVSELTGAVRSALGAPAVPKVVRFAGDLPLRGPGKVDRSGVRTLFASPTE